MATWTITTEWRDFPGDTRAEGQVFAIGDVHGRADLLDGLLAHIGGLPAPDAAMPCALVFLGDLIDRGPENLRAIRLAMGATLGDRPAIVLPGNHEGMLLDGLDSPTESGAFHMWYENGGHAVLDEIPTRKAQSIDELRDVLREALPDGFLEHLRQARSHHGSGDLLFVHAGIVPPALRAKSWCPMEAGGRDAFLAQPLTDAVHLHWAWIREPFISWTEGWDDDGRQVVVHGHTVECEAPIEDAEALVRGADRVAGKRRINLDLGAVFFGRLAALEAVEGRYRFHCTVKDRALAA